TGRAARALGRRRTPAMPRRGRPALRPGRRGVVAARGRALRGAATGGLTMERIDFARILSACVLGALAWLAPGKALAINCNPDDTQLRLSVPSQVYVNRLTAQGPITTPNTQGTQLVCTGGPVGTPIEVALRVHPALQAR